MSEPLQVVVGVSPVTAVTRGVVHFRNGGDVVISKPIGDYGMVWPPDDWDEAEVRAPGFEPFTLTRASYDSGENRKEDRE